jgi:hypothetical protein
MGVLGAANRDAEQQFEAELFEVLSNQRRRFVVYAVSGHQEVDLGVLARRVAAWENGEPESRVTSDERKRVYTALQQSHLPKLADAGLIEFDDRASVVRPQPSLDEYEVYMEVVQGRGIPWNEYYLGLSAVAAALVAAVWIDVFPFYLFPDIAWMAAIVTAFTVSAVGHTFFARGAKLGADGTPPEVEIARESR